MSTHNKEDFGAVRTPTDSQIVSAISAAGFRLLDRDWNRRSMPCWAASVEHPSGFQAQIDVTPSDSLAISSIAYAASTDEEFAVIDRVIEELEQYGMWCEGNYEVTGERPRGLRYFFNAVKSYEQSFEAESFAQFLRSFAEGVIASIRQIPG